MACRPTWPRDKVKDYVMKYITADPSGKDDAANNCVAGPAGAANSYIMTLPADQQQQILNGLKKVVPALANEALKTTGFKTELESKCQVQMNCFNYNSKWALMMLADSGNVKSSSAGVTAITGAFKSCFPGFNRTEILKYATDAINDIAADKDIPAVTVNITFQQCEACSGDSATKDFNEKLINELSAKVGNLLQTAQIFANSPAYECIGHTLENSRVMLWKSKLFCNGDTNILADAITGAIEACKPTWPRDHVKNFVSTYIFGSSSTSPGQTTQLYPAMFQLPKFEERSQKLAMLAAVTGVGLFLAGMAIGKRIWGARQSQQISRAELELTAEEGHLLQS